MLYFSIFGILMILWLISLWFVRHEIREMFREYMATPITETSPTISSFVSLLILLACIYLSIIFAIVKYKI